MEELTYKLNGRFWLEINGEKMLGRGRVELLERIKASGSIRQAALQMKMSYKQAWDQINYLNDNIAEPAVISHRGGKGGGKAVVTPTGESLILLFYEIDQKFQKFLQENSIIM